jgi:hypothetical protein
MASGLSHPVDTPAGADVIRVDTVVIEVLIHEHHSTIRTTGPLLSTGRDIGSRDKTDVSIRKGGKQTSPVLGGRNEVSGE